MTNKEAKATIEFFQAYTLNNIWLSNKQRKGLTEALDLAIKALEEKTQGEWISKHLWDNTHIWVCSECGNQNTHGITVEKACWKCGAQMKGGAE